MAIKQPQQNALKAEYMIAAAIVAFAGLLGMAAWMNQGSALLWSLIESGLAWCL